MAQMPKIQVEIKLTELSDMDIAVLQTGMAMLWDDSWDHEEAYTKEAKKSIDRLSDLIDNEYDRRGLGLEGGIKIHQ